MKKIYYTLSKILMLFACLMYINNLYSQCSSCTLSGWKYVKEVTIDNSAVSTSATNIQELITIDTQTPISAGKMDAFGNDIRFVDSNCNTPLCYWIESGINTANTKVWVMLPSLAANSVKTFFMFYGNTSAPASSNFACVFPDVQTITGVVTLSGNQNHDWIDIQVGSTVNVGVGQILSFKARKIIMAGAINGNNCGYGAAAGPGAGGNGGGSDGGGGGGYGGKGGSGKCPGGNSGALSGTASGLDIDMGSGGGGSDCSPAGGGGGAVKFEAAEIAITGNISMNGYTTGGSCNEEAAGGGSGGGILVYANNIDGTGSLSATGGIGQGSDNKEGGGGGGGGRIKLFYCTTNNYSGLTNVSKGSPGNGGQCSADDAQDGTSTINTFACEIITVGPEQYAVIANAGADISYCSGSSAIIGSASIAGYTYSWSPSTGLSSSIVSNPTVLISNSTSSNIVTDFIVTANAGGNVCSDTVQVTVFPLPTSTFSATGPVCVAEALLITYTGNASPGGTYVWDFNGGTIISGSGQGPYLVSWPVSGIKTITLTVIENGCISSTTTVVTTVNPPDANAGNDVFFCSGGMDTLGVAPSIGYTYSWLPTAGLSNSTISNPTVSFTNYTSNPIIVNYYVTTTFTTCSLTDTVVVTVNPAPVSNAGNDVSYCSGDSALIGTTDNPDYSYSWLPANGLSNATISNPIVALTNNTSTPLVLSYIVTTTFIQYNCTSTDTVVVTVFQVPTSSFSITDSVCVKEITTLNYTGNATTNANYVWNFNGGTASPGSGQGPQQIDWLNAGITTVSLSVSENACNSILTMDTIIVKPLPISDAGNNISFCSGESGIIGVSAISGYTYLWSPITIGLSDVAASNPTITLVNPTSTIQTSDYIVSTTSLGCSLNDTVQVTVYPLPVANFDFSNVCLNQTINFNDLSIEPNGTITNWTWNFGDDSTINVNQNVSHLYNAIGSYSILLSVVSSFGCIDSVTKIAKINPNPIVNFTADDSIGCEPLCVNFQETSTIATGSNILWAWNFGDGSTAVDALHCYINDSVFSALSFNVTLTVTSDSGCVSTFSKNNYITVYPNPNAAFTVQPGTTSIYNPIISFHDLSTGVNFWNWNFGNKDSSSLSNPSAHEYSDTGTYIVTLITSTQYGCLDTAYQTVIIEPDFIFYIPTSFSPNGDGINDVFSGKGVFIAKYEMMIFDRWGNLIYKTTDINQPWNGKGNKCNEISEGDVYVYSFTLTDFKKEVHLYKGIVTLVR